jgi:hypothetical protein
MYWFPVESTILKYYPSTGLTHPYELHDFGCDAIFQGLEVAVLRCLVLSSRLWKSCAGMSEDVKKSEDVKNTITRRWVMHAVRTAQAS